MGEINNKDSKDYQMVKIQIQNDQVKQNSIKSKNKVSDENIALKDQESSQNSPLGDENDSLQKKQKSKPKNPGKAFQRVFQYTWKYKHLLILGLIGLVFSSLGAAVMPFYSGQIVDEISKGVSSSELGEKCLLLLIIAAISGIFSFQRAFSFNLLGEKVMYTVRNDLYTKILNKDTDFFDSNKSGELMSRITSDTTLLQSAASDNISILLRNIVSFLGSLGFLWYLSYELTLIMFSVIPPVLLVVAVYIKYYKKYKVEYQNKLSYANGFATEAIGNIRIVKSFGNENKESINFQNELLKTYNVGFKKTLIQAIFIGFIVILGNGIILIVLYFGGKMVIDNNLSIGDLTSFVLYTITMSSGLVGIGNSINTTISATGVAEKLFEIMDLEPKIVSGPEKKENMKGEIEFKKVTFAYPSKLDVQVLKNVDLKISQGQSVAIVGQSGSGKSSIISLIERFYDVQEGQVLIDNQDVKLLDSEYLHHSIGFVSQEPTLFSGTLKENIVYGVNKFTLEDIDNSIKMANAYDFINDKNLFPLGLDTVVGERGVKLSGGQKQRIAIARALIKNPSVLIFDEATSALDAESEFQVQYAIDQLVKQGDKTIIIIAHRLSTIINCNKIIVLQNGGVAEQGSHQELLEKNSAYSKLIKRQLANYKRNSNNINDQQDQININDSNSSSSSQNHLQEQ